ncbi:maleylacetate reductase [Bauldia litoralis]|uniref:Alcohol dehydrogenase, class IV n=1 Tax=Bauldia litoralis TaxID=665467 RepID=A0A1G6BAV4_9HYPH|nr:maleylacetate reductase [Bauldia litoralis]SDB17745.1 Alcohol dehydrogenase, class IV [Bauldia litoralis]
MPLEFAYQPSPQRIVFGSGKLDQVAAEAERLGITRAMVLSTPGKTSLAEDVAGHLGDRCAAILPTARMHTPVEVTDEAMTTVEAERIDGLVAIGGGSTTGLGKAIAYRTDLPQLVLPTTYSGSELTDILGQTEDGEKTTIRDARVLPETVIYDVGLTLSLPVAVSVTSAMNAMAHAVEGLYAPNSNPILALMAEEGIRALGVAIPGIVRAGADEAARGQALYGAWLCGTVLGGTSMALHHKLCHVLGGSFGLPHAETHTVILPHAAAYNAATAPDAMAAVARALGADDAPTALFDLAKNAGAPMALRDIGMPEDGLDRAAEIATANPYPNPRPLARDAIRKLLDDAWHGRLPAA